MSYDIKRHEVDRLLNVLVVLGWEIKNESYETTGVTLVIHREIPEALLKAAKDVKDISTPS